MYHKLSHIPYMPPLLTLFNTQGIIPTQLYERAMARELNDLLPSYDQAMFQTEAMVTHRK